MIVGLRGNFITLVQWQANKVAVYLTCSSAVTGLELLAPGLVETSPLPISILGGTIGIFVAFRTNSAYQRWWEGRQLWGRLVNNSRHWAQQISAYLGPRLSKDEVTRLVMNQSLYTHTLRCVLRGQDPWADAEVLALLPEGWAASKRDHSNPPYAILVEQMKAIVAQADGGRLDPMRLSDLEESLRENLAIQGGCERILRTPLPRGYGFIAEQLVVAFSLLMPLGMAEEAGVITPLITTFICLAFILINEVGRVLEDPFTLFYNGLPLSALCRTIEINLREVVGLTPLPPALKPDEKGILM